jgi:hypothetical protein
MPHLSRLPQDNANLGTTSFPEPAKLAKEKIKPLNQMDSGKRSIQARILLKESPETGDRRPRPIQRKSRRKGQIRAPAIGRHPFPVRPAGQLYAFRLPRRSPGFHPFEHDEDP